LNTDLTRK